MTKEETAATMKQYRERRIKLGISTHEFGKALGFSGTAISSWELMKVTPKLGYMMLMGHLLDDLESGRKSLPRSKASVLPRRKRRREEEGLPMGDLAMMSRLLRRMMWIDPEVGREALGIQGEDFTMKESGLLPMTKEELARLLHRYADTLIGSNEPDQQLTFASQLSTSSERLLDNREGEGY